MTQNAFHLFRASLVLAALSLASLSFAGCASVPDAIQKGDLVKAEAIASKQKGEDRRADYKALAEAALKKGDYALALRCYKASGDYMGAAYLAQKLEAQVPVKKLPQPEVAAQLDLLLDAYRTAVELALAAGKGEEAKGRYGPRALENGAFASLYEPRYLEVGLEIARLSGHSEEKSRSMAGDYFYDLYRRNSANYKTYLPAARNCFESAGDAAKVKQADYAYGDMLILERRFDEAFALFRKSGDDEKAASGRVAASIYRSYGRSGKLDDARLAESFPWFDRAGDAAGRAAASFDLGQALAYKDKTAEAEQAFRESGKAVGEYGRFLAGAWFRMGDYEAGAAWLEKAGLLEDAKGYYFTIAQGRMAGGDIDVALSFLAKSGKTDRQAADLLKAGAKRLEEGGDRGRAAALYARAGDAAKAEAAYLAAYDAALAAGELDRAIEYAAALESTSSSYAETRLAKTVRARVGPLIEAGRVEEAYRAAAKADIGSPWWPVYLVMDEIVARKRWKDLPALIALSGAASEQAVSRLGYNLNDENRCADAIRVYKAAGDDYSIERIAFGGYMQAVNEKRYDDAIDIQTAQGKDRAASCMELADHLVSISEGAEALAFFDKAGLAKDAYRRYAETLAATALERGDKALALEFYARADKKDRVQALRSELAAAYLAANDWDRAAAALKAMGLGAAEIRKRSLEAAVKTANWEDYLRFKIEGGSSEKEAARATAEAALKAEAYAAAVTYYEKAGDAAKAQALLVKAADQELRKGVPGAARMLYEKAGKKAEAERAAIIMDCADEIQACFYEGDVKARVAAVADSYLGRLSKKEIGYAAVSRMWLLLAQQQTALAIYAKKGSLDAAGAKEMNWINERIAILEFLVKEGTKP